MANSPDFIEHCLELLASLGPCRARRMFGGHGLYRDELMFALVVEDTLYLKADDQTRERWARAGSSPFVYSTRERTVEVNYWTAPDEALESPAGMQPWATLAWAAALRARKKPPAQKAAAKQRAAPAKRTRRP